LRVTPKSAVGVYLTFAAEAGRETAGSQSMTANPRCDEVAALAQTEILPGDEGAV